jgi:hypothetical protein
LRLDAKVAMISDNQTFRKVTMMRALTVATLIFLSGAVLAQTAPALAEPPAAAHAQYTTADTEIGTLLDDPAAKAVLVKHIPDIVSNDQINMARSMTLKGIQQYSPDKITDAVLVAIDTDLARLPAKK